MSKLSLYQEMRRELEARRAPLQRERVMLQESVRRIPEIDAELEVIDAEIAEYNEAIDKEVVIARRTARTSETPTD